MKKIFKIFIIVFPLLVLSLIAFDLHFLRGYFFVPLFYRDTFENFKGNINYTVKDNHDGTFDFALKNEDLAYYPIILYREEVFFDLSDTILFSYATRYKISSNETNLFDTGNTFGCGNGLAYALIRPYESFELKRMNMQALLGYDNFSYVSDSLRRWNISNDSIANLECKFYLPIFSFAVEDTRVYSNKILAESLLLNN